MPLTYAFALKVGLATLLTSAAAFGYCGLIFAIAIDPLLKLFSKEKHHLATEPTKKIIAFASAAFCFAAGPGAALMGLGFFTIAVRLISKLRGQINYYCLL
tara:strand:- start:145 stop:447 length:303 start_codon:yes stop_codon:yes gene_type:complete